MADILTAVIIARDAAETIDACVRALAFCDRVWVAENRSQDDTAERARAAGAEVVSVPWEGYARTKNRLLDQIDEGWILSVDADEIATPALGHEIRARLDAAEGVDGYWVSRRNYFLGREIRHAGWSPDWQLRLIRAGTGRFEERRVHEGLRVDGPTARLCERLPHYTYPDLESYVRRFNAYTTLAARDRLARGRRFSIGRLLGDPPWTFFRMYVLKGGAADGMEGFILCVLSALNTFVKHAKHWALCRTGRCSGDA
mgnify:CR=1 FL=1